jgi:zinc/manganese transport system substrate-binding protein
MSAVLLTSACVPDASPQPTASSATDGRLRVVATFSIIGDLVRNVGGDAIDLTVLVGPDSDSHTYEPSPANSAALARAQVIIENGVGFESWLDELVTASGSQATRIVAADGVTLREAGEHTEEHDGEEHEGEAAHDPGAFDPHIWHNVKNALQMVRNIQAGLTAADPEDAATYQANADVYLQTLAELDAYVVAQAATVPADRRRIITNHDALGYFCEAYGFTLVGDVLGALSTEASEPSAQELARLVDRVRVEGASVIFIENVVSSDVANALSRETGVRIGGALYTDALSAAGGPADTYEHMIRANIDTIVAALK